MVSGKSKEEEWLILRPTVAKVILGPFFWVSKIGQAVWG